MAMPQPEDWLAGYARVQRTADREVLALLRQAIDDINPQLRALGTGRIGAEVSAARLAQLRQILMRKMAETLRRTGDVIAARRLEAAARAAKLGDTVDQVLFAAAGRGDLGQALVRSFTTAALEHTLDSALTRMGLSRIPLAQQVYRTSVALGGQLDRKINSALARGLPAREFAAEVRDFISPNTPGGVRYASMRLARTEINNAFHAMTAADMADKPWIVGSKWHLSGSHPRADQCDKLAKDNPSRLGVGVYKRDETPSKPHPQCLCYVTGEVEDDDDFLDALVGGKYDNYLKQRFGGRTEPS